ncbi:MAG: hypothetical protein ACLUSL_12035 [Ruminococcus sp.]
MRKEDNIETSVRQIEVFDTIVAFLAGMIIVPAVFVFSGGDRDALNAGPGLMFVTLPNVFDSMAGGQIVGVVFFLLVVLAAMTSSISLMETVVSMIQDRLGWNVCPAVCWLWAFRSCWECCPSSDTASGQISLFSKCSSLDFFDYISNNIMMPIVALMTCIRSAMLPKPPMWRTKFPRTRCSVQRACIAL